VNWEREREDFKISRTSFILISTSCPPHITSTRVDMADPPSIQPLVSSAPNSSSASTSPPVSDLNSLRQKSLQQAQQDLSNRSQSPTSTSAQLLSQTVRRNAVDQTAATPTQSTPTPTQPPTKTVTGQGSAPAGTPSNATGPQATPKPPQSAQNIFTQPIRTFQLFLSQVQLD